MKDIVLIGAGHAHLQVIEAFARQPIAAARLTVITDTPHAPYSGMLPGLIAGHYTFEDAHVDVAVLCRKAGARLLLNAATGLDLAAKTVLCEAHPPVGYDILSINIGSTPNTKSVPGADLHAIPVKPISRFLPQFARVLARTLEAKGMRRIALVGAGAGGVELMLALAHRLRRDIAAQGGGPDALTFTLVSGTADILPAFPRAFRWRLMRTLGQRGICVMTGAKVVRVEPGLLHLEGGDRLAADDIFWVTEAQPPAWLTGTGLPLDRDGFIRAERTLGVSGLEDVFAAGDAMAFGPRPLPKSGVYAVRQGPVLAENLRRAAEGRSLRAFVPQRQALYILSTGPKHAVAVRNGITVAGAWVWRWKDWLDRRFMRRFKA